MTTGTLAPDIFLSHIKSDAARMAELAGGDLDAAVPPCPGWTVREAVVHTGAVYSHKVACMRKGQPQSEDDWLHGPEEGQDTVDWFRARLDELTSELTQRGADAPAFTWYEPIQTVGFWYRRMAQETAVHRVDVESAFDAVTPVDDALAIDGIDEVLDWFLTYQADDVGPDGPGRGTVAVRTGDHIWRVTLRPDDVELSREPGSADAVVSGEPSELLLWLWGRRPDAAVGFEGDGDLVSALRERLRVVTQ
jgi:uncharacterized protein (TIGR03083 family)